MHSALLALFIAAVLSHGLLQAQRMRRNIVAAKSTGLPYRVVSGSLLTPVFLLPLLDFLPRSLTEKWLPLVVLYRMWHAGYAPFDEMGVDTFVTVSVTHNALWTCDPAVVSQICRSRDGFPKATRLLQVLNVYGPTVTATDGDLGRQLRRIAQGAFNERTLARAWSETLDQTEALLEKWRTVAEVRQGGTLGDRDVPAALAEAARDGETIEQDAWQSVGVRGIGKDLAKMTLRIISRVCFGSETGSEMSMVPEAVEHVEPAAPSHWHQMSYEDALSSMLSNIKLIFGLPGWLLRLSPLSQHQLAWKSFEEWRQYMEQMYRKQHAKILSNECNTQEPNLLESLVRSSMPITQDNKPPTYSQTESTKASKSSPVLSKPVIMGNIFIFLLAGHETSASTLQFALTCLACHPHYQRMLQASIDAIIADSWAQRPQEGGSRQQHKWSYTHDFPLLYRRFPGAVLAETVRLFTVLPFILRQTPVDSSVTLRVPQRKSRRDGSRDPHQRDTDVNTDTTHLLPPDMSVLIDLSALHRHPSRWTRTRPAQPGEANPAALSDFDPCRWLRARDATGDSSVRARGESKAGEDDLPPCAERVLFPGPGEYIPFSSGNRSCIGSRFAEIEVIAVLARIFSEYSVELVPLQTSRISSPAEAWEQARLAARSALNEKVGFGMALHMNEEVPLRIVPRSATRAHKACQ